MILFFLLAIIGHGFIWVAVVNVSHAVALPRWLIHAVTYVAFFLGGVIPPVIAWLIYRETAQWMADPKTASPRVMLIYLGVCFMLGAWAVARWAWRRVASRVRSPMRHNRSRITRLVPGSGEPFLKEIDACLMARLPGNELLWLEEIDRGLEVARLPEALARLAILHLSDLHFTGLVGKWYFEELVRRCNARQPDLVAITGDCVDEESCIDWVPDTLGKLQARYGVYYILGNHERRIDAGRLRGVMKECGLIDLGGRFLETEIRGQRVVLAGNEVPWFLPAADFSGAPPSSLQGGPIRIVLAHSPDQLAWARRNAVDLLLTGHTHGGQVCLPLIGPIFAPCRHGVRYPRGAFLERPTVMHVTKGVSAQFPLRLGAMPEAVKLTLHPPGLLGVSPAAPG